VALVGWDGACGAGAEGRFEALFEGSVTCPKAQAGRARKRHIDRRLFIFRESLSELISLRLLPNSCFQRLRLSGGVPLATFAVYEQICGRHDEDG